MEAGESEQPSTMNGGDQLSWCNGVGMVYRTVRVCIHRVLWCSTRHFYGFEMHMALQIALRGGRAILAGRFAFMDRQAWHNGVPIVSVKKGGFDSSPIAFKARLQTMQEGDGNVELLAIKHAHARMQVGNGGLQYNLSNLQDLGTEGEESEITKW